MKDDLKEMLSTTGFYYWTYDNGWQYDGRAWSAYSGPYFAKSNFLLLLHNDDEAIVIHYFDANANKKKEIDRICLSTKREFLQFLRRIEQYRLCYCSAHHIDPEKDIEHEVIGIQNKTNISYRKLTEIPSLDDM